jgi:hypothetical protein
MIVGTATTGVTLVCVLIILCIGLWTRFCCEQVAVPVVQENPVGVVGIALARVQSPIEIETEVEDPQPVV